MSIILLVFGSFTSANPLGPLPVGPSTNGKTCIVQALGNQTDDTPQILEAFANCNNGGTVIFPEGQNYWIGTKLNPIIYDGICAFFTVLPITKLKLVNVEWRGLWTVRIFYLPI